MTTSQALCAKTHATTYKHTGLRKYPRECEDEHTQHNGVRAQRPHTREHNTFLYLRSDVTN